MTERKGAQYDTTIFREELEKRVAVPDGEYEPFLALWQPREFKKNELILRANEVPKFSLFVLKGCLRQYLVNESGVESIVYFAEERYFIGDLQAMRKKVKSNFYFQALEDCVLLTISSENWETAFAQFPWWAEGHLTGYQKWVAKMQQRMADMNSQTAETKYLNLLKERPSLFQRVPQHYIASYLGISPETLSRIRKKIFNM